MKWLSKYGLLVVVFILFVQCTLAQRRVACIGDSVTKGLGLKDSTSSYPYQLQKLLGEGFLVGNFGHSGATLLAQGHNPYIKTKAYADALAFVPDIVVISLGLNDTDPRNWPNFRNEFFANYSQLIADFRKINPRVEVFVCTMSPIFSGHTRFLSGTRDWFDQIQSIIPIIAQSSDAVLIDNYRVLKSRFDLFEDNIHPSAKGASLIAENVFAHLVPLHQLLSLAPVFGSNMVLQRNVENKIFGQSNSYEPVTIVFDGKTYTTEANSLGYWDIVLPSMKAGGPYSMQIATRSDRIHLTDILFGDVYLASGQSNMAFQLQAMVDASHYLERASDLSTIRLFNNVNLVETNPIAWDSITLEKINNLDFFSGQWEIPSASTVQSFSAIAYVFAEELSKSVGVPIGIIQLAVGGSNTESWMPRKALEDDNLLASYIHTWRKSDFIQDFCRSRGAKNLELATIKNQRHPYDPAYNFEAGVEKWKNTKLAGVLWYQGESNAHNVEHHAYLFEKLVASWRDAFHQDLPFYFVQLSSIDRPSWPSFRDSQRVLSNKLHNVYMAVSYDVGDAKDVHPHKKEIIGKRLANLVKQHAHKMKVQADAPSPISYSMKDGEMTLVFNNCKALMLKEGDLIKDLQVVNAQGAIVPITKLVIDKNKIRFRIPNQQIRAVQYAYTPFSLGNLVSDTAIPVSTFNINIE